MWYNVRVIEEASLSIAKPRNVSLVDTLSAGYRTLNRRPMVLAIPAALSAYLWLGAPLSLGPVADELHLALSDVAGALGAEQAAREELVRGLLASDLRVALAWLNFVPVLAPRGDVVGAGVIGLSGPLELIVALVLVNLLALLVSSFFLTTLGEALQGERGQIWARLRRSGRVARDICLALLALAGVGLILALPFLAISVIVIAILPGATLLVLLSWYIALFWAYVYTGFAPEAIALGRAGPLRALYKSVHVVRRDLGGTLGLLLLSFVIASGLGVVWRQLAVSPPGLAIAILGSAYVGSGLAAARLQFYRDRERGPA
jgi:hypothetical protein